LELFIPVCFAIQHAHQKGIVHRDVKPSNVMITLQDDKPLAKVIDFGLAKALYHQLTDLTLYTGLGAVVGTPEYMAPEQAQLSPVDIDTRCDVYALGALLFELLTGSRPLSQQELRQVPLDEALRLIREKEAPLPSARLAEPDQALPALAGLRKTEPGKLLRMVKGELDWIVMKALEKDRTRRYETANDLARDVQRYLANEPVEAGPPSASYRLRKLAWRYRAVLSVAAAFVLVLVGAATVSAWLAMRAIQAEAGTRQERDVARAVGDFLLNDLLSYGDPGHQARPGLAPDRDIKLRTLLDRAAANLPGKCKDKPTVEAAVRETIGRVYATLGEFQAAEPQLKSALEIWSRVLGPQNADTLLAMSNLGAMYSQQGQFFRVFTRIRG